MLPTYTDGDGFKHGSRPWTCDSHFCFVPYNFSHLPLVSFSPLWEHCGIVLFYREELLISDFFTSIILSEKYLLNTISLFCWEKESIGADFFIRSRLAFCEPSISSLSRFLFLVT